MRRRIQKVAIIALSDVLAIVLCMAPATVATAKNWADGTAAWSPGTWSPAGVPTLGEAVNIVFTDGTARTVTLNVSPPSLGLLSVDLTGAGTAASALSMPNNNTLTANGIVVGGYNGITAAVTAGRGAFTQSAGTTTTNPAFDFTIGYGAGSSGVYSLSGSGALVANHSELVGFAGTGTFNHSAGTNTLAASGGLLDVGALAGSTGTYNLSGTGTLTSNVNEYIGDIGTGVFNQTGGTHNTNGAYLYIGYNASGAGGTYNLSAGALSQSVGVAGGEFIGYRSAGTFNQSGGTHIVSSSSGLNVGTLAGSTGLYTLSAGSLFTAEQIIGDAGAGTFTQTGGSNGVGYGQNVLIGNAVGSTGIYNLSGSGSLGCGHDLYVGYGGSGTINQIGGDVSVSQVFTVGYAAGATGTYNLSGGSLLANGVSSFSTLIGDFGTGTFNQSGGTSNFNGVGIVLGNSTGGSGTFALSGGTATVARYILVGGSVGAGTGALTVSGSGVLTVGSVLQVVDYTGNVVNLSGGTINTAALDFGGAPARLNWTSGTLNVTNNVTWDSAAANTTSAAFGPALALGSNQTLMVTGNETLGGAGTFSLTLNSDSTHTVTGAMTIATNGTLAQNTGSTLTVPTITQAGGTVNGTLQNQTTFNYQSGLFNGRLVNQGTVSFGSSFVVGNGVENNVTMTVGAGQTLTANGAGLDNRALFTIASGGNLVGTSIANQSEFIVNGSATAATFTNSALMHGVGQVTAAVTNAASGDVRVVAGERLRFAGASFSNQGLVEAIGNATSPAEIEFNSPVTNASSTGLITGRNNVLRFNGGLTNQGSLAVSIGASDVFGDISNSASGKIVVSGGAGVTFYDDVVQNGTFRVSKVGSTTSVAVVFGAFSGSGGSTGGGDIFFEGDLRPGNSPARVVYENNVSLGSGVRLDIELGGTMPGSEYDQVHVTGALALGGTLKVDFIDLGAGLFAPHSGDSFNILDWGSVSGIFSAIQLPTLAGGLTWNTSQLYSIGILSVAPPGLPGDYNLNGVVDAADYVVWRKGLDTTYTQADYDVWRAHFGQTAGSGAGASAIAAVPEPATLVLLMFAAAGSYLWRRRYA